MVFARKADDNLASLVKSIDAVVAANADKKMASFVNILGEDAEETAAAAKAFADKHQFANVAICVATDLPNGPEDLNIAPGARITVMSYVERTVKANHAFGDDGIDAAGVRAVVAGTNKIIQDEEE